MHVSTMNIMKLKTSNFAFTVRIKKKPLHRKSKISIHLDETLVLFLIVISLNFRHMFTLRNYGYTLSTRQSEEVKQESRGPSLQLQSKQSKRIELKSFFPFSLYFYSRDLCFFILFFAFHSFLAAASKHLPGEIRRIRDTEIPRRTKSSAWAHGLPGKMICGRVLSGHANREYKKMRVFKLA